MIAARNLGWPCGGKELVRCPTFAVIHASGQVGVCSSAMRAGDSGCSTSSVAMRRAAVAAAKDKLRQGRPALSGTTNVMGVYRQRPSAIIDGKRSSEFSSGHSASVGLHDRSELELHRVCTVRRLATFIFSHSYICRHFFSFLLSTEGIRSIGKYRVPNTY